LKVSSPLLLLDIPRCQVFSSLSLFFPSFVFEKIGGTLRLIVFEKFLGWWQVFVSFFDQIA
jgi:hypothetical protein